MSYNIAPHILIPKGLECTDIALIYGYIKLAKRLKWDPEITYIRPSLDDGDILNHPEVIAHIDGYAVDVKWRNIPERDAIVCLALESGFPCIRVYRGHIHLSIDPREDLGLFFRS